jgi:hypothetical protein
VIIRQHPSFRVCQSKNGCKDHEGREWSTVLKLLQVSALQWPLNNSKWHYSTKINKETIQRLKDEMDKFPFWHDDGLDICSYLYDVIKDYKFSSFKLKPLPRPKLGVV